jgi:hypothetical protein
MLLNGTKDSEKLFIEKSEIQMEDFQPIKDSGIVGLFFLIRDRSKEVLTFNESKKYKNLTNLIRLSSVADIVCVLGNALLDERTREFEFGFPEKRRRRFSSADLKDR